MSNRFFDLNVETILADWSVRDALRELIANALDETVLTGCRPITLDVEGRTRITIRDYGRGLQIAHLTQNENAEKQDHDERVIGQFGVGLKDALATLYRRGVQVRLKSRHGVFSLRKAAKHGFEDITTLHVGIDDGVPNFQGTEITLEPVAAAVAQARGW